VIAAVMGALAGWLACPSEIAVIDVPPKSISTSTLGIVDILVSAFPQRATRLKISPFRVPVWGTRQF
jgi:hypothetical protein